MPKKCQKKFPKISNRFAIHYMIHWEDMAINLVFDINMSLKD